MMGHDGALNSASYGQQIKERLRDRIVSGDLKAGDRLNEVQLAAELGVSRTPLREAIASLAAEGWVEQVPHRGARVVDPAPEELQELLELRTICEVGALRLIFAHGDHELVAKKLRQAAASLDAALGSKKFDPNPSADFHLSLLEYAGNSMLIQMGTTVLEKLRAARFRSGVAEPRRLSAAGEHASIIEAVEAGDFVAASESLMFHLDQAASAIAPSR